MRWFVTCRLTSKYDKFPSILFSLSVFFYSVLSSINAERVSITNYQCQLYSLNLAQQSLEVLCECGVTLSKNFERLLSQAGSGSAGTSSASGIIDGDMLSQSVATWELAHKVATTDTNSLISELLPLLQETVQSVMKDPSTIQSSSTYEVRPISQTEWKGPPFWGSPSPNLVLGNDTNDCLICRSFDPVFLPSSKSSGASVNSTSHVRRHKPVLSLGCCGVRTHI